MKKMKKMKIMTKPLPAMLALALVAGFLPQAQAADATLNFTGEITAGTCKIATGDANKTITLDKVSVTDFKGGHASVGGKDFDLTAECTGALSTVTFRFNGTANPDDSGRFANTGSATGIGMYLGSRNAGGGNSIIYPGGTDRTVNIVSGKAVIPLHASYYTHYAPGVGAGTFVSTVTADITYK